MASASDTAVAAGDRAFFGHPRGLGFLSFAEAWERFSYYGMMSLLALYMTQQLLLPGHVEHVAAFRAFRAAIEHFTGPLSPVALATMIVGLYSGAVYATPIIGGILADQVLGRTRAIIIGAVTMAVGHFLMAFEASFLLALTCLLVGVGLFKGNIATQVGQLYAADDLRRADAFQVFMLGIQIAVIAAPLVCGTLGEKFAWHWGFGAAGVGMLLGLVVYLSGRKWLPPETVRLRSGEAAVRPRLVKGDGLTIFVLVLLLPVLAITAIGNQQIFNAYLIWGKDNYNLAFGGQTMPVTWLISLDAFISMFTMIGVVAFWRWWGTFHREPDEIVKLAIGAMISAFGPLALAAGSFVEAHTGHKVGLGWGLGFHILNDIGFANVLPVGLALYTRAAPRALGGLMIGVYYLHLVAGNLLCGWLGKFLVSMTGADFWLLHAGLIGAGAVVMLIFAAVFGRILAPKVDPEAAAAEVAAA
jgi:POT family proton-dependent oligopeptide transporter